MYIDDQVYTRGDKTYRRVLIRHSYRQGKKVKNKTIANISSLPDTEIQAIKIALKMKDDLPYLEAMAKGECQSAKSVGSVALLYQVAQKIGLTKALGVSEQAKQTIWLVIARLLGIKSRLAAVRAANQYAAREIIGLEKFNEDDLYRALSWLDEKQDQIEISLLNAKNRGQKTDRASHIYLYDLTSTYLEGTENDLAGFGYNRDQKKGKKQINYGLLTDADGDPISVEAFRGNIKDNATLENQLIKLKERFGCRHVTVVGDKGMIKSGQIELLAEAGFNYITSITKPQIVSLVKSGIFQYDLFDEDLLEIEDQEEKVRYVLRRNPLRLKEVRRTRKVKIKKVKALIKEANDYLSQHPRAKVETQLKKICALITRLKMNQYAKVETAVEEKREVKMIIDGQALKETARLDGCYVIKTDLPKAVSTAKEVHDRYKDLALVEWAFRTEKSDLKVRPVYLRREDRTRAHLFVVMMAYKIERVLRAAWSHLDLQVSEGLSYLGNLTAVKLEIGRQSINRIPKPDSTCKKLITPLEVTVPTILPYIDGEVVTRRKLPEQRNLL